MDLPGSPVAVRGDFRVRPRGLQLSVRGEFS